MRTCCGYQDVTQPTPLLLYQGKLAYKPDVAALSSDARVKEEDEEGGGGDLVFTTTSEFCRSLQGAKNEIPAVVIEEKKRAAMNHSTGVTELVKRAGEGKWNETKMQQDGDDEDAEMGDAEEMEDDGAVRAITPPPLFPCCHCSCALAFRDSLFPLLAPHETFGTMIT